MSDYLALEQAILEDRDDPEPYLVYADWLAKRGDPRAELIVVQHRCDRIEPENGQLLAYRDELLRRHPVLVPALDRWRARYRWRWGFIERAELDDPTNDDLELLFAHPSCRLLRHLSLDLSYDDAPLLVAALGVAQRPTLEVLRLEQDLNDPGDEPYGPDNRMLRQLPRLRELVLGGRDLLHGLRHDGLRTLRIVDGTPVDRSAPWHLPALGEVVLAADRAALDPLWTAHVPALRTLDLEDETEGEPPLLEDERIAQLIGQLEVLRVAVESLVPDPEEASAYLRAHAPRLAHLRELVLHDRIVSDLRTHSIAEWLPNAVLTA